MCLLLFHTPGSTGTPARNCAAVLHWARSWPHDQWLTQNPAKLQYTNANLTQNFFVCVIRSRHSRGHVRESPNAKFAHLRPTKRREALAVGKKKQAPGTKPDASFSTAKTR